MAFPGPVPHTLSPHLCIEFVNSRFNDHTGNGEVYDRLDMPEWRRWFTGRCGVAVDDAPGPAHAELVTLRARLRELLESGRRPGPADLDEVNRQLSRAPSWRRLSGEGDDFALEVRWEREDWDAVMSTVAASYCELLTSGGLERVRRCANPHCSWIFFDESRNGSRRWCDPSACGNLLAVRRHRGSERPQLSHRQ